jgi:hypothetical protein
MAHVRLSDHAEHLPLSPGGVAALLTRRHAQAYQRIPAVRETRAALTGLAFDAVVSNDAVTLPVALEIAGDRPVVADMHEYAPLEMEEDWRWRLLVQPFAEWICAVHLGRAAAVTTVSPGLASRYRADYGVDAQVVTNAGHLRATRHDRNTGRPIRIVHSGNATPNRGLDVLIDAASGLDGIELDLLLVRALRSGTYLERLRTAAARSPNVRVLDPVPLAQLVPALEAYDVGLGVIQPTNFGYLHTLPNKFFDFVQAGLAVLVGPSPDLAALVREHDLGLVTDGFDRETIRAALASLKPGTVDTWRANARAARPRLSSSREARVLRRIIAGVLSNSTP